MNIGCITIKDEQVEIERKAISLSAFGIEGNQPIKFELKIKLLKEIEAETSYWKLDSVGLKIYFISFHKKIINKF